MAVDQRAEIMFLAGRVWTGVERRVPVDTVAVRDGRIIGVGTRVDLRWALGPRTRVIPLEGRLLVPGFGDSHVHPIPAGVALDRCRVSDLPDVPAYLEAIAAYRAAHPDRPWVVGEGWTMGAFAGNAARASQLDEVVPDRPALLESADGHVAWVNSAALALAGITAETPDPAHGRIERHRDGTPLGTLHEDAIDLVRRHAPADTAADLEAGLVRAQAELHRVGVTAWQEAHTTLDQQGAYLALAGRGQLTGRAALSLRWDESRGLEQMAELVARREAVADADVGRVRATSVKLFQDGIVENRTAALLEPYLDGGGRASGSSGVSKFAPAELRDICVALDRERFAVHAHTIGDRAVRELLDALTVSRTRNGPRAARHHLAHLQLVHPADQLRFRPLGVAASCQAFWAFEDEDTRRVTRPLLGAERVARMYPFGSLQRHGVTLALGSDWSVTTPDPLQAIDVAIRRTDPADPTSRPLGPASERLSVDAALRAATRGSAYVLWTDDEAGTIEVGRAADLALLDRDPLAGANNRFSEARVLMTLVEGRPVWEDPSLGA